MVAQPYTDDLPGCFPHAQPRARPPLPNILAVRLEQNHCQRDPKALVRPNRN